MNINATQAEVLAVTEALKLASLLDDRTAAADKARIAAWAEQVHRHHLGKTDLLDGVQAFYDSPSDHAIQIGDLIKHARQVRRDRPDPSPPVRRGTLPTESRGTVRPEPGALFDTEEVVIGPLTGDPSERLERAKTALQTVTTQPDARQAIIEYFAARRSA
jgi:hypothetical protein